MASFFEAEVYFASVSGTQSENGILRSLNTPERFLEYRFEGKQIQRLLEAKFAIVYFVQHWILNTEFLLQYLAAHVISALHLGVRFLSRSGTIQLGNFLEWIFLVRLER
ncbi:unnamed protein product [Rhizophagus irregularis]|nr:unnamed protein product [Rhizophagus irregularis]